MATSIVIKNENDLILGEIEFVWPLNVRSVLRTFRLKGALELRYASGGSHVYHSDDMLRAGTYHLRRVPSRSKFSSIRSVFSSKKKLQHLEIEKSVRGRDDISPTLGSDKNSDSKWLEVTRAVTCGRRTAELHLPSAPIGDSVIPLDLWIPKTFTLSYIALRDEQKIMIIPTSIYVSLAEGPTNSFRSGSSS